MRELFSGIVPFVHTARERSFRRAAERLGVTPAAISKAVQKLEAELGVALLNRTTRRVSLSPEGELFLGRCEEALAQLKAGRELIEMSQADPRGELTVTAPHIVGRSLIARLPRFRARYPQLHLHLRFTDRFEHLVDAGIDVAIRVGALEDSSLVARRLMTTRWVTVAAPAYLSQHGTPRRPDQLEAHDCLKFQSPRGTPVEWTFSSPRTMSPTRFKTTGPIDVDQGELLLEAAVQGLGITQALDFMVVDHVRDGRLVEILSEYALDGPSVHGLCLPEQRNSPRVRAFLDFLAQPLPPAR
jgi:DNA-binding transcriptional LysR family regulator